jgi:hypothetical protein
VPGKGDDPTEAGGRGTRLRPPSDGDWAAVIFTFRVLRSFEDAMVLQRAEALPAVLEEEASALCSIADELDRTLDTRADVWRYQASVIIARVEGKGYADDVFWHHVRGELVRHLLEPVERSPSALRQRAFALRNAAEDAQSTVDMYTERAKRLRGSRKRGPPPSVAMYTLFTSTDHWSRRSSRSRGGSWRPTCRARAMRTSRIRWSGGRASSRRHGTARVSVGRRAGQVRRDENDSCLQIFMHRVDRRQDRYGRAVPILGPPIPERFASLRARRKGCSQCRRLS